MNEEDKKKLHKNLEKAFDTLGKEEFINTVSNVIFLFLQSTEQTHVLLDVLLRKYSRHQKPLPRKLESTSLLKT